ncbi:PIN domain-containing protein [Methanolobus sp. WCC1]|uniref:PilT domain protein n=1 Tax=Methanolobus tindarius DSM 2278 TaxID=1090322 RepID=W9DTP3_METTI|nr:PIN domain-containing protein [Methanolobus tindarius]ETA69005.1 PilT domain protein [Methanolobus tindarius DSM 2278]
MKVIIDTNALMIPVQFKVDIFEELKRLGFDVHLVPTAVITELDNLIKNLKGQDRIAAKVARSMAQRCETIRADGHADDVILEMAMDLDAAVLTNDIGLRRRLEQENIPVICLRQKNRLEIVS